MTDAADAERQEPILRAIVEYELHERIFQGTWQVIPAFTSQDANAASLRAPDGSIRPHRGIPARPARRWLVLTRAAGSVRSR